MPVKFMLRTYLQTEGVFNAVINSLKLSNDGLIRSLIDGSIWQERTREMCCRTVIPINIYFDDFTTSDTSSCHSKSTSICAVYLNIPSMPAYLQGKLSNILTVGFIKSQDRKKMNNDKTLHRLIELLIELETKGITVSIDGEEQRVFFVLGFIVGDNLGVNGILDYVESFRANFFCRVCKRRRIQTETDAKEHSEVFRSPMSYDHDVRLGIVSETGIKASSPFNKIPSYHVTHNFVFDIMHDIFEGVGIYDLQHMLYYFVYIRKYFSVSDFNERKNNFVYGNQNSDNIIHDIQDHHLKMKRIKCTANEMKTLIIFLPLIIGPLIPENDEVWQLACSLVKIVHIVLLRDVPYELVKELRSVIEFHHTQYVKLFQDSLKPKHHNLVHYPTAILKGGALRQHWCMRFEAKHREPKAYCKVNSNRINMCSSIAVKSNFKFAYNCMNKNFVFPKIQYDETQIYLNQCRTLYLKNSNCNLNNIDMEAVKFLKSFVKCETVYNRGSIFNVVSKATVNIYKILEIFLNNDDAILLLCEQFEVVKFNTHLQSFELNAKTTTVIVDNIENCESQQINLHDVNNTMYLRLCNYYKV